MSDIFVGIDPGSSGALAAIDADRTVHIAEFLPVTKTPKSPVRRKRKNRETGRMETVTVRGMKTEFDFSGVADLFDKVMYLPGVKTAVIEDVTSLPRDSVTSAFTFGGSFWALQMALADRVISYEKVKPKVWQDTMLGGIYHSDPKALRKAYLAKARSMFPKTDLSLVKHAEVAAALLLAEYCRRLFVRGSAPAQAAEESQPLQEQEEEPGTEDLDLSIIDPLGNKENKT